MGDFFKISEFSLKILLYKLTIHKNKNTTGMKIVAETMQNDDVKKTESNIVMEICNIMTCFPVFTGFEAECNTIYEIGISNHLFY